MRSRLSAVFAVVVLFCFSAYGQQTARSPKTEQAICDKLAANAPQAVEPFQQATAAMDANHYQEAVPLFRQVLLQAPLFTPAMRRLGASLAGSGQFDEGLSYSQQAVKIERSPENLASLAQLLAFPAPHKEGSPEQIHDAFLLSREAADKYSGEDDASYFLLHAQLALMVRNVPEFRRATEVLVKRHPELVATHYFNAVKLVMDEDWISSENEIKAAERLGLPPERADAFLAAGIHRRAMISRSWHYAPYVIGAWIAALALLFLVGKIFSTFTLRLIESADTSSSLSRTEVMLRSCYRRLITVAGSFYYVSLPFVIVLVLGLAGGIVYGVLMMGYFPIKLVVILVIGAVVTVYKMVQTLFVRVDDSQPGRVLRPEEAPNFWTLTREVADKLGTRPLDQIRITPGTEMAVYEQGTRKERRDDKAQRTLLMGIGLIPGFSQNSFRAILAHEYGHLSHRDTAGGDVALRVNQDMMKSAIALAVAGQAVPWNIGFQFLRLYHFLFRRISYGATRLQEVLADRAAAGLYGAQAFEEGLTHVVRRQIEFHNVALNEVRLCREAGASFRNIYTLTSEPSSSVEEAIDKALHRQTSEDDTHPSPVDRFRLVSRPCQGQQLAGGVMWDLFPNPEALTSEMSSQIESQVKVQLARRFPALAKA